MEQLTILDTILLIAAIASLVLAIVAIGIAIVFYRFSNDASKSISTASEQIRANVDRLEKLFDKLYSDTFSIMKDTVTDMRHHIWKVPDEKTEKKDEIDDKIKSQIESEVKAIAKKQHGTEVKIDKLTQDIEQVIKKAMKQSQKIKGDSLKQSILLVLPLLHDPTAGGLERIFNASNEDIALAIFNLGDEGKLNWVSRKEGFFQTNDTLKVVSEDNNK